MFYCLFLFSRIACEGSSTLLDYGVTVTQQCYLLDIRDIGVTIATLGFGPKRRGLTPLYPSNYKNMKYDWSKERIESVIADCDSLS